MLDLTWNPRIVVINVCVIGANPGTHVVAKQCDRYGNRVRIVLHLTHSKVEVDINLASFFSLFSPQKLVRINIYFLGNYLIDFTPEPRLIYTNGWATWRHVSLLALFESCLAHRHSFDLRLFFRE